MAVLPLNTQQFGSQSLSAVTPTAEQRSEIGSTHNAIVVSVAGELALAIGAP